MSICLDCKYYNCYDDGDNRLDIWCSETDWEFSLKLVGDSYPLECKEFKEGE